jgi:hypothetical protein
MRVAAWLHLLVNRRFLARASNARNVAKSLDIAAREGASPMDARHATIQMPACNDTKHWPQMSSASISLTVRVEHWPIAGSFSISRGPTEASSSPNCRRAWRGRGECAVRAP